MQIRTFTGTDMRQVVAWYEQLTGNRVQLMCGNVEVVFDDRPVPPPKGRYRKIDTRPYWRRFGN